MAFGQGETLVSPLQMADAYATFANGGTLYAPEPPRHEMHPTSWEESLAAHEQRR